MSHMVIYRGADGKPGYHQTDDIHDAVGFVEQIRNDEGVEHARIFRLEEVVFEYRPYYRVELSAAGLGPAALNGAPTAAALPEVGEDRMPAPATIVTEGGPAAPATAAPVNGAGTLNGAANGSFTGALNGAHGDTIADVRSDAEDSIELTDDVIDVIDDLGDGEVKAEAGVGKKGLFGR